MLRMLILLRMRSYIYEVFTVYWHWGKESLYIVLAGLELAM